MAISFQDADKFRLKHAEELLALFEGARSHPARTTDELAQWLDSIDDDLADEIARAVARSAHACDPRFPLKTASKDANAARRADEAFE
jgi:hypothetical protein